MSESPTAPGPIALVGSGEYLPEMADLEASLLEGRPPIYVQLATAAVPDGPAVVEKWQKLGQAQAERLGVTAITIDVNTHDDANNEELASQIGGAGLIYLSGGNPGYLADTLRDTAVWEAIEQAWREGSALAGCSAGAMALSSWVPSIRHPREGGTAGLGLLPHLRVIPHFDAFSARMPDFVTNILLPKNAGITVVGIDEQTAMVGGPSEWTVQGHQSVWLLSKGSREELPVGTTFTTPV
jgi:cyanophycinase-like exopeptidase